MTECRFQGCPGEYEAKTGTHTVRHEGELVVIDQVPAEACLSCGDVLLDANTVRGLEQLLQDKPEPASTVPVYEYAERSVG
jgi:YgiT-type zinc finger domain-containing protein